MARDPHGFRPLAFGRIAIAEGGTAYVFASETCAFDLINAEYVNDVEPGEMVCVGPEGMTRERCAPAAPHAHCVFEHVYFSRPDSIVFGRPVQQSRENLGRLLARESGGGRRRRGSGARLRRRGRHRLSRRNPASRSGRR